MRRLLDEAFEGGLTEDDWHHTLGGIHILALEGQEVVAHAAVVGRTLVAQGRPLPTGYAEAVATRPDRRLQGYATLVMGEAGRIIERGYRLGALSTARLGFYERFGWEHWQGPTFVASPLGLLRTPATGDLDLAGPLTCDWRPGDAWYGARRGGRAARW